MKFPLFFIYILSFFGCQVKVDKCSIKQGLYFQLDSGKNAKTIKNYRSSVLISNYEFVEWGITEVVEQGFVKDKITCIDSNVITYNGSRYIKFIELNSNDHTLQFDSILIYKRQSCFNDTNLSKFVFKIEPIKGIEIGCYMNDSLLNVLKGKEINLCNTFVKLLQSSKKMQKSADFAFVSTVGFTVKVFKGSNVQTYSSEVSDIERLLVYKIVSWLGPNMGTQ